VAEINEAKEEVTWASTRSSSCPVSRIGFSGSPTVLVDGRDPFAAGSARAGLTCRRYRTERGVEGAPSVAQLRAVIAGG
jgi:hypothetical protein